MVAFLTMEITRSQDAAGVWLYIVPLAAFATSAGIEAWGIIAGANLERSWRIGKGQLATAAQLAIYVAVTMWLLRHNSTLIALPIVAALVYLAAAMTEGLEAAVSHKEIETVETREWQRERERVADARRHELDMLRIQSDRELAIEQQRIAAENEVELIRARAEQTRAKAEQRQKQRQLIELQREQEEAERIAAESRIGCEDCGREFTTIKALNAHGQWCKAKVPAMNGHVAHSE
jgi:hypothetical protein